MSYQAGVLGLFILKSLIVLMAVWLLTYVTRGADPRVRWWLVAQALMGIIPTTLSFRPHLWTVLGLSALLAALEAGAFIWIPALFVAWANLHGGWIVGLGVLGLWSVGRTIDARRLHPRFAAVTLVAGLATIATPYGWRLWHFLATTIPGGRAITEWLPLWAQDDPSHGLLWSISVAAVGVSVVYRPSRWTWAAGLPIVALGVSGLFVDRLAPLFALATCSSLATVWHIDAKGTALDLLTGRPAARLRDAVVVAMVVVTFLAPATICLPHDSTWGPDLVAASALRQAVPGRLVLPFGWGEYAIWHFGPGLRVSIDGRRETVYSPRVLDLDTAVEIGDPAGLAFLEATQPEYVWLPQTASQTHAWLQSRGYRQDISTPRSIVAVRGDLPALPSGPPASACFP